MLYGYLIAHYCIHNNRFCRELTHQKNLFSRREPTLSVSPDFLFCKSFPLQPFFFFVKTDYTIPQIFTVTSEHIRLYFCLVFSVLHFLVVVSDVSVSAFERTLK